MSDFKGVGEHELAHDILSDWDLVRGSQRSRQSTIRNQDVSKMTEKKGKKMEEEWMFWKPLYFKSFLQGWAYAEKGKAELRGAEETFESSMATQEEPGR